MDSYFKLNRKHIPVVTTTKSRRRPTSDTAIDSPGATDKNLLANKKIRPELNLEKWSIWQPAKSQNAAKARVFERSVIDENGGSRTARVEIGFTNHGVLTTEDQKVYYALIKFWEEGGRNESVVVFSLRQLAATLKRGWGTNVIESLTGSLQRLGATPINWTDSYFNRATGETLEYLEQFQILAKMRIARRKKGNAVLGMTCQFKFNDYIITNLLANHTKPVYLETVLSFNNQIAQVIYTHLDLVMSDKTQYERRTKELFADLGLEGSEYRKLSVRRRVLERALLELSNTKLSTGTISYAGLEFTKDKSDLKVVFRKTRGVITTGSRAAGETYLDSKGTGHAENGEVTTETQQRARRMWEGTLQKLREHLDGQVINAWLGEEVIRVIDIDEGKRILKLIASNEVVAEWVTETYKQSIETALSSVAECANGTWTFSIESKRNLVAKVSVTPNQ